MVVGGDELCRNLEGLMEAAAAETTPRDDDEVAVDPSSRFVSCFLLTAFMVSILSRI